MSCVYVWILRINRCINQSIKYLGQCQERRYIYMKCLFLRTLCHVALTSSETVEILYQEIWLKNLVCNYMYKA